MDWRTRIALRSECVVRKPVIKGTRMSVELIIEPPGRGHALLQVIQQYPHITADDIQACLAYAGDMLKSERVYAFPA